MNQKHKEIKMKKINLHRLSILLSIAVILIAIQLLTACTVVGPGQRGVRISLGTVSEDPKPPGAYLWLPFILGMAKINVQIQKDEIEATAATKDMQDVATTVAVNWSMSPDVVVKTYKEIGDEDDILVRIIRPAVNEVLKSATSKRNAEEVLTKRLEMKHDVDEGLKDRLAKYGITLQDVSITNLKFSHAFTAAIEAKQVAEQRAQEAVYEAQKATQDAKAAIEQAKGQAASQVLVRESLTPALLQKMAIEKWNGQFPQYMGGSAPLPFLNLNK